MSGARHTALVKVLALLVISAFVLCRPGYAKIVDKIVAVVNDEVITQSEVDRILYPLYEQLSKRWKCFYDQTGAIGRRYRRQDEIGTPLCITVDFDTIEKDDTVTVRDRDTMEQIRLPIAELESYISNIVDF